ncbi:MAG: RagB/SusD family nutrient uptake outer membrane protein [Chitinophagaceae bacterium]|nr:RagB/SusD family nutrient uptake outer membrane protein [Chitinophagaceae bacterium]
MKRIIYLLACASIVMVSCKKMFLEEMKSYDKFDESVFTNEAQTGMYIDRLYNYFFASYRNPLQAESITGAYDDAKTKMTEEFGGTVSNWINPNRNLQLASDADAYYGAALTASVTNNPYTRIRFCNFLLEKMDGVGQALPESFRRTSRGQMFFLRGYQYFQLVRRYGGVPLELKVTLANNTDAAIRTPRSTSSEVFAQIAKDFDSAAALLPGRWENSNTNYGRATSAAALAMKSRALLTAASPLFNKDWDNPGSAKWQAALDAGLKAETQLTTDGYGLYGTTAREWAEMTYKNDNSFNKEAIMVMLLSSTATSSVGYNNSWENQVRPKDYNGGGGISVPKAMLDLFPLANGVRPTQANGYVDTFFFENRDPRFYRTFAFSGTKWGRLNNANKTTFFYRWKVSATGAITYHAGNQTSSPAVVRKNSNPAADTTALNFSGTDIFEYRYAELLLNIAECYAAKGDIGNAITYLGKIRARVGIPSANNYGIGTLADKYAAIEACLYERRIELAYEGKRYWDIQRWLLYGGVSSDNPTANTTTKLGLTPINGTNRTGYYWQSKTFSPANTDPLTPADRSILIDPDATPAAFAAEIAKLKTLYQNKLVMTPLDQAMDRDGTTPVNILFRPNYYLSGLTSTILSFNPWLLQNVGWLDYSGGAGTFDTTN